MKRETVFSPCRKYRYTLWREWDVDMLTGCSDDLAHSQGYAMFIGLNPSTADETKDDPTIRRCVGFAKAWGYGALCMTNLFAFRATDPKWMLAVNDPVGPDNAEWLLKCAASAGLVIAAWGNHGAHMQRGEHVRQLLKPVTAIHALRITGHGEPQHPLYLRKDLTPIPFEKGRDK